MTDARLPERWLMDRRIQRLNAEQFRAYTMSLMYAVSNRTDGELAEDDLEAIPHFNREHIASFIGAGLWRQEGSTWVITDFIATQTSRAQLEALEISRAKEAQRSAQNRARAKATAAAKEPESSSTGDSTAYGTAYDTGQARPGQDRQKTVSPKAESNNAKPNDPKTEQYRSWIESHGITTVRGLALARSIALEDAQVIWDIAYAGEGVA